MAKIFKNTKVVLVTILLVATFLRLWHIDKVPVSLFGDELDLGYQAYSVLKTGKDYYGNTMPIHFHSLAEWRTPLYLYSAVPTVALFGISQLGVRLPAAIFGVLSIWAFYLLIKELFKKEKLALLAALVLTFSPWHIQYSRAGFEVTELLFFLIIGLYLFLRGLRQPKWIWVSMASLALTPWVYSTAKLFLPLLLLFLVIFFRKEIIKIPRKYLVYGVLALILVGGPIAYSTVFGGGSARFNYVSVFTDPTVEPEVGVARQIDARVRGEKGEGLNPSILDRLLHNKFTFWIGNIGRNYFQALSFDFLFNEGDPNLRHSINGIGQFYKLEAIPLVIGVVMFFVSKVDKKLKFLMVFWILAGVIPSVITRDGGNHATRLILILPPLAFLISYGLLEIFTRSWLIRFGYTLVFAISFGFFIHNYFVHSPWDTERWWHYGWQQAIGYVKDNQQKYDKVVISSSDEPPWVFFAAWYPYPPQEWQKNFPIGNDVDLSGFGKVSHIDKFYFGSPGVKGVYEWGKVINKNILYLASAKEVNVNLIMEPERTPTDLKLLKAVAYPSGEPAFYLFTGK